MKYLKSYKIFESNVNSIIDEYLQNCKWDIKNSIGNCAFFSKDFYEWCQSKGIECKLMYLKQDNLVSDEIEDHIIPMVDGQLIDFVYTDRGVSRRVRQNSDEAIKRQSSPEITPVDGFVEKYSKWGYNSIEDISYFDAYESPDARCMTIDYPNMMNEASVYIQNSQIKDEISDILLELKDDFGFHYFIQNYLESDDANKLNKGEGTEFIKVNIMRESSFDYRDIEDHVERLKRFMQIEGWNIWDYTCYLGHRPPTPKIERDLRRQYNRFGTGEWTESCWTFSIKFVKGDNSKSTYMWMCGGAKSTNEELNPATYKSAAELLQKKGHTKRPAELMKWHDIVKKKLEDESKTKALNNVKQLGVYQCNISIGTTPKFTGNFYLNLQFQEYNFKEEYSYFVDGESGLWMPFSIGVVPADEESEKYCQEVLDKRMGISSDKITYWIGDFRLHLSNAPQIYHLGDFSEPPTSGYVHDFSESGINDEEVIVYYNSNTKKRYRFDRENDKWVHLYLDINPKGSGYFENWEGDFNLVNRRSAMQFKSKLYDFFAGRIILQSRQSDDEKGIMIETFCNELGHTIDEYEMAMESIKRINLNTLYKD